MKVGTFFHFIYPFPHCRPVQWEHQKKEPDRDLVDIYFFSALPLASPILSFNPSHLMARGA